MPSNDRDIARFRSERERLRQEHAAGASGLAIARGLSDAVDELIRSGWARADARSPVALVAVGGYGRREMAPSSDVDLMVLHAGGKRVKEAATSLFYVLWNAGLETGHSIRTTKEALRIAAEDVDAETAFLDARLVAGDASLFEKFTAASLAQSRAAPDAFAARMRASTTQRAARAGDASAELQPNLKDGRGGLRDLHTIAWLTRVCDMKPPAGIDLTAAADLLHRARNELHLLTGRHSDVLLMELQRQVARAVIGRDDDQAEDDLMRALYARCRDVAYALDVMFDGEPATITLGSPQGWSADERHAFLDLLARGEGARPALRALERSGALELALPEWENVACLPQRNPYHRFPVDTHAFETVAAMMRLGEDAGEVTRAVFSETKGERDELLLAALLHDIGKGTQDDHAERGEVIARAALARMGIAEPAASEVAWHVRNHLLLADVATRRDLNDERPVVEVAERVGSQRRLRVLYLLTVADGLATGSAAWTPWKASLVEDLFVKASHVLERGELVGPGAREVARVRTHEIAAALPRHPAEDIERHLAGMPRAWLLSQSREAVIRQTALMLEPLGDEPHIHVMPGGEPGVWELTVVSPDHPGLLATLAGALALNSFDVHSAHVFTRADGVALDVFRAGAPDGHERRFDQLRTDAASAVAGTLDLRARLAAKRRDYHRPSRGVVDAGARVTVDNAGSDFATVVEVYARDRIGLLYAITDTLGRLGLDIQTAKVATDGTDVVDVFYVRDAYGQKVDDAVRAARIREDLLARLSEE